MTNAIHGTGLRRSPNATSLLHTIINLVCREIDKAGRKFENQKIHFAFHILRNAIHVHECRVAISKVIAEKSPKDQKISFFLLTFVFYVNWFFFSEQSSSNIRKNPSGVHEESQTLASARSLLPGIFQRLYFLRGRSSFRCESEFQRIFIFFSILYRFFFPLLTREFSKTRKNCSNEKMAARTIFRISSTHKICLLF